MGKLSVTEELTLNAGGPKRGQRLCKFGEILFESSQFGSAEVLVLFFGSYLERLARLPCARSMQRGHGTFHGVSQA